jgi:acetylornithine deacetylase
VTDRLAASIEMIADLVAFDTESSRSNLRIIEFIEAHLTALDIPFVRVPNAAGDKAALFATIGPPGDGGIVLSGHTDVVPVTGQSWTSDPFRLRREGARLYGRGACDMKGFGGIALAMIEEFKAAPLRRPIHILLTYDEETTCLGPLDTIARFGRDLPRPAAVIVGEPTLMQVADAHKGVATYVTTVHGKEAHSSRPMLGANAIEAACRLVGEIYRIGAEFEAAADPANRFDPAWSTVSVGQITGGTARNILARECRFHWEFRNLPGMEAPLALHALERFIAAEVLPDFRRYAPEAFIETTTEIEVPALGAEPGSIAETLGFKLTRSNHTIAVPFATEAGRFQGAGIPTIVCGPGSIDQAHQPDEWIDVAQIESCIGFMRRLADELV